MSNDEQRRATTSNDKQRLGLPVTICETAKTILRRIVVLESKDRAEDSLLTTRKCQWALVSRDIEALIRTQSANLGLAISPRDIVTLANTIVSASDLVFNLKSSVVAIITACSRSLRGMHPAFSQL